MSTKLLPRSASPRFVSQSANTTFDRGASEDEMPFPLCESPVPTRPESPRLSERPSKVTIMPEVVELLEATATRREDVVGGHTVYTVKGKDSEGLFEAERRFKEFVLLRKELTERWPGVYIPPLPPKKAFVFAI